MKAADIIAKIDAFNFDVRNTGTYDSIIFQYQTKNRCGVGSDADFSNKIMFRKQKCFDKNGVVEENCTELVKVVKDFPMCPSPSVSKTLLAGQISSKLVAPQIINLWEKPYVMKYPLAIEYRSFSADIHCVEF